MASQFSVQETKTHHAANTETNKGEKIESEVKPGSFYCKPQIETPVSSTKKSRKRNRKGSKALSHPVDVVTNCLDLGIKIPKNGAEVPSMIKSIKEKLEYFQLLNEQRAFDDKVFYLTQSSIVENIQESENVESESNVKIDCTSEVQSEEVPELGLPHSDTLILKKDFENNVPETGAKLSEIDGKTSFSDNESGVGDEDISVATIIEDSSKLTVSDDSKDAVASTGDLSSCLGYILGENDPNASTDSTSSGCSSNLFVSVTSPHSYSSADSNYSTEKLRYLLPGNPVSLLKTSVSTLTPSTVIPTSSAHGNRISSLPPSQPTPSIGPLDSGFCALPPPSLTIPTSTEEVKSKVNWATIASRNSEK